MQSLLRQVSFAFVWRAYFAQRKVSPRDFVVAPSLEHGVPFLIVAALAGATLKARYAEYPGDNLSEFTRDVVNQLSTCSRFLDTLYPN